MLHQLPPIAFLIPFCFVEPDIECSHLNLESQGELCSLCGVQKRRFEPTVLYCQGKCGMQRIKRNAAYFTDRTKQNHWCDSCFALLDPVEHILLDDGTEVSKKELQEFKNDALPEEGWVNCDECHSWVHQVRQGRRQRALYLFACCQFSHLSSSIRFARFLMDERTSPRLALRAPAAT